MVSEMPTATLGELQRELQRRTGVEVHVQTIHKALRMLGIERARAGAAVRVVRRDPEQPRYGYTSAHRRLKLEQTYPSCLTDAEWALVEDLFDHGGERGAPPKYARRLMVDACCYVVRTGCAWRRLPKEFGPWQNVYRTFRRWSEQGKFEHMHQRLRALWRQREGRAVEPTAASVQDRDGAHPVVAAALSKHPSIQTLFVDSAYAGSSAQTVSQCHGIRVDVVRHPGNRRPGRWLDAHQADLFTIEANVQGFVVPAKRWVVERTHAWNECARRLVMHHDRLCTASQSWVWLTEARLLLRRLTT
jgi:transposase